MATVYVEARPKGRSEGSHIDDYVVEDHADHALATFKTQHEAIDWAKKNGHSPHVPVFAISTIRKKRITGARCRGARITCSTLNAVLAGLFRPHRNSRCDCRSAF